MDSDEVFVDNMDECFCHDTTFILQAERDAIECELKSANEDMKDEFLNALSQDGTINEVAISTESLGRLFGPLQKQVCCSLF